jgi:hypothetical protein
MLEDDPMDFQSKCLSPKPGTVALRPMLASRIGAAMPQEEGKQLLASPHQVHGCIDTRAGTRSRRASSVASGTHIFIRSPDRCRIASFSE